MILILFADLGESIKPRVVFRAFCGNDRMLESLCHPNVTSFNYLVRVENLFYFIKEACNVVGKVKFASNYESTFTNLKGTFVKTAAHFKGFS